MAEHIIWINNQLYEQHIEKKKKDDAIQNKERRYQTQEETWFLWIYANEIEYNKENLKQKKAETEKERTVLHM